MAGKPQYTAVQFIAAIPGSGGIISSICQTVGCSWGTAKRYIDQHPNVTKAYRDELETILDKAESMLIKAIEDGDLESVKWYLARKGKHRGYAERQEISGPDGNPIQLIEIVKSSE